MQRALIDKVSNAARIFAEWNFTKFIIDIELEGGDVIVKDGTLQTVVTNESKYANAAYDMAIRKGVVFSALSKTSTLFTTTGYPLLSSINEFSLTTSFKDNSWYYYPIVDILHPDHRAELYVVKLHPQSDYVFRFEILRDQAKRMDLDGVGSIIATLAENSKDISFPGYPYSLVDADRFARVETAEKEMQEVQFMSVASYAGLWKKISRLVKTTDAHIALNKLLGE